MLNIFYPCKLFLSLFNDASLTEQVERENAWFGRKWQEAMKW
jgi:hypothetical protein